MHYLPPSVPRFGGCGYLRHVTCLLIWSLLPSLTPPTSAPQVWSGQRTCVEVRNPLLASLNLKKEPRSPTRPISNFFSAPRAASGKWKATNRLGSCPRFRSHAFGKGKYLAGSTTRGMPGGAPGRIDVDRAVTEQPRNLCWR